MADDQDLGGPEGEHEEARLLGGGSDTDADASPEEEKLVTVSDLWHKRRLFFVIMVTVAFSQGLTQLAEIALSFFLKDDLKVSPARAALVLAMAFQLPWLIKPLYGFWSDGHPIFGLRRKPYLITFGIIGSAATVYLAREVDTVAKCVVTLAVLSLSFAFIDVIADAMVVENCRGMSQRSSGVILAIYWMVAAGTACASSFIGGLLLEFMDKRNVFLLTAVAPLLVSFVAIFAKEDVAEPTDFNEQYNLLIDAFSKTEPLPNGGRTLSLWKPTLFLFLWQASPSSYTTMFYFLTNELKFSESFIGVIKLVGCSFSLMAVVLYQTVLSKVSIRTVVFWGTAVMVVVGFALLVLVLRLNVPMGISDGVFAIGDRAVLSGLSTLAHYPLMLMAIRLCPKSIEGTMYAAMMSASNLGAAVSVALGGVITEILSITEQDFTNLWILVTICTVSAALPLFFVNSLLPASDEATAQGMAINSDTEAQLNADTTTATA